MGRRLALTTATAEDTRALGEALATLLQAGDVVSLTGDLGAGKTTLTQGLARGLGVREPVLSPTFTLVREYEGTPPVYHLDVYRLRTMQEVMDLGLDEMLDRGGVVCIEWGDVIAALLPARTLQAELTLADPEAEASARVIELSAEGEAWALRWERLEQVIQPWKAS